MNAGNHLHIAAVALGQAETVEPADAAGIAGAEVADFDVFLVLGQNAGHGGRPQQLIADVLGAELVQLLELVIGTFHAGAGAGYQLQQRFAIVDGDVRVAEGTAQGPGVKTAGQLAIGLGAQGFPFDADAAAAQRKLTIFHI